MSDIDILLPIAMLVGVLALGPLVLWLDARKRQLEDRVATAVGQYHDIETNRSMPRSIRVMKSGSKVVDDLGYRLLRMPIDLPLANVVPPWLVFVVAIVAGMAITLLARIFVPLPVATAIGVGVGYALARTIFGGELRSYQDKLTRQLPDSIELVVSATRAGLPVAEAFRAIGREMPDPTREEFRRVGNEMTLGLAADEALMNVHRRTRVTEYAIFAVTVAVQSRSGGRIAEPIQNLAEIIRQRQTIDMRAEALSAEARLSARIMSTLPFVGGALMSYMHPGYLTPLFTDPRGKQMFVIGVSTLLVGMFLMRRLVKSVAKE